MQQHSDIAILDERGAPAIVVEVKTKMGTTASWAASIRRNLVAHSLLPNAKFFVVAAPDRFYFWVDKTTDPEPVLPDFVTSPERALSPYFEQVGIEPGKLLRSSLEMLISGWLAELSIDPDGARLPADALVWAQQSGFLEAVRRGRLQLH